MNLILVFALLIARRKLDQTQAVKGILNYDGTVIAW
jgi:hypothetical protein